MGSSYVEEGKASLLSFSSTPLILLLIFVFFYVYERGEAERKTVKT